MDNKNKKRVSLEELYPAIQESLDTGGTVELPITGTSMLPLLVQGRDTVLIKKAHTVKKGDIIFYRRDDGHFVLHRIVGKNEKGYILCGDNQWKKEYGILQRHIIAVVTTVNRKGKEIKTDDFGYMLYSKLWMLVLPIRKYILYISRKVFK